MLLVSFHGGAGGITNVYAYDTATGKLNTQTALQKADQSRIAAPAKNQSPRRSVIAGSTTKITKDLFSGKIPSGSSCPS